MPGVGGGGGGAVFFVSAIELNKSTSSREEKKHNFGRDGPHRCAERERQASDHLVVLFPEAIEVVGEAPMELRHIVAHVEEARRDRTGKGCDGEASKDWVVIERWPTEHRNGHRRSCKQQAGTRAEFCHELLLLVQAPKRRLVRELGEIRHGTIVPTVSAGPCPLQAPSAA